MNLEMGYVYVEYRQIYQQIFCPPHLIITKIMTCTIGSIHLKPKNLNRDEGFCYRVFAGAPHTSSTPSKLQTEKAGY